MQGIQLIAEFCKMQEGDMYSQSITNIAGIQWVGAHRKS